MNLAKVICLTMEDMDTVPDMPFIGDDTVFNGKVREYKMCKDYMPKLDLSAWAAPHPTVALANMKDQFSAIVSMDLAGHETKIIRASEPKFMKMLARHERFAEQCTFLWEEKYTSR